MIFRKQFWLVQIQIFIQESILEIELNFDTKQFQIKTKVEQKKHLFTKPFADFSTRRNHMMLVLGHLKQRMKLSKVWRPFVVLKIKYTEQTAVRIQEIINQKLLV